MKKLILVRHSEPKIEPGVRSYRWHLSNHGKERCIGLAERLAAHAPDIMLSSTEPKARETAEIAADRLGIPVAVAEGLHEHERKSAPYVSAQKFRDAVEGLFARPNELVYGEETADQARERFGAAIKSVLEDHQEANIAVVAHGTVISLFIAAAAGIDAMGLWEKIGMPSYIVLSRPDFELLEIVESI
jgi:2,3-bisphosphoglycerate-dependent phosphoglycerate mutase